MFAQEFNPTRRMGRHPVTNAFDAAGATVRQKAMDGFGIASSDEVPHPPFAAFVADQIQRALSFLDPKKEMSCEDIVTAVVLQSSSFRLRRMIESVATVDEVLALQFRVYLTGWVSAVCPAEAFAVPPFHP